MNILFRADASSSIGTGHIMRDLVLAQQYPSSKIFFATQELKGNLNSKILESGHEVISLLSNNIEELIELINRLQIDMVIIDHYSINYEFEKELKERTNIKLMVLDDTYEKHYCDILLNHNISGDKKRYKNLVPNDCELRVGSKYTLIRQEFIDVKNTKTILIAMGGADDENISLEILQVLKEFKNITVNLVTTTANPNIKMLQRYIEDKDNIKLHINSTTLAILMKQSDFAIVSPSVVVHEVLYMELPFVAIKTADNQNDIYDYLKNNNYLILNRFNTNKLKKNIKKLIGEL